MKIVSFTFQPIVFPPIQPFNSASQSSGSITNSPSIFPQPQVKSHALSDILPEQSSTTTIESAIVTPSVDNSPSIIDGTAASSSGDTAKFSTPESTGIF